MGIDFFDQKLTGEQVKLEEMYVRPVIGSMAHGEESYIDPSFFWIDAENRMWVDVNAARYKADEVHDFRESLFDEPVRCIRILNRDIDGFVIDASAWDVEYESEDLPQIEQRVGDGYDYGVERLPVIGWVSTQHGLDELEKILDKQFEIELGACAVRAAIEAENDPED